MPKLGIILLLLFIVVIATGILLIRRAIKKDREQYNPNKLYRYHYYEAKDSNQITTDISKPSVLRVSTQIAFDPYPDQIIYFESNFFPTTNWLVEHSFEEIDKLFVSNKNCRFIYLPKVLELIDFEEYCSEIDATGGIHIAKADLSPQMFYNEIINKAIGEVPNEPVLLRFQPLQTKKENDLAEKEGGEKHYVFSVYQLPHFENRQSKTDYLEKLLGPPSILETQESNIMTLMSEMENYISFYEEYDEALKDWNPEPLSALEYEKGIDGVLDFLRKSGASATLLDEVLNLRSNLNVSLHISDTFAITLPDHDDIEIAMPPLSKAIYFLYLRHPEGIPFKKLSDHVQEIEDIYMLVSRRENLTSMQRSVSALADSTSNSINEKCSRIRKSFIDAVGKSLAEQYYISGNASSPKKILLDRSLVFDDSNLILPKDDKQSAH